MNNEQRLERKISQSFIDQMQSKLDENEHKLHWSISDFNYLTMRLHQEVSELFEALYISDLDNAKKECADVANFAMMIFDNLEHLPKEK